MCVHPRCTCRLARTCSSTGPVCWPALCQGDLDSGWALGDCLHRCPCVLSRAGVDVVPWRLRTQQAKYLKLHEKDKVRYERDMEAYAARNAQMQQADYGGGYVLNDEYM